MLSKLTYKMVLEYFLNDKKVIVTNEISNNGLATTTISIGDDMVSETSIRGRVLSGESRINNITSGYEYIYDEEGTTIDLKAKNDNVSVNDSVSLINKLKASDDFFQAKMFSILANNKSASFIACPSKSFFVYKEATLVENENTYTYFLQQNFTSDGKVSNMDSEEENYQINEDYVSFTINLKDDKKNVYCNIDEIELDTIDKSSPMYTKIQSILDKLTPLKELLESTPKTYKDIKINSENKSTKKAIR